VPLIKGAPPPVTPEVKGLRPGTRLRRNPGRTGTDTTDDHHTRDRQVGGKVQVVTLDQVREALDQLEQIELSVKDSDRSGLRARWECGHVLLAIRGEAKHLPDGFRQEACARLHISPTELTYRMQFADRFPTEAQMFNVLNISWHDIVTDHLPQQRSDAQLRNSSESNEWYTPRHYLESARKVLGAIDLDPASCPEANRNVRAAEFFTKSNDGLARKFYGRIWCNPPYGGLTGKFTGRIIDAYEDGDIEAAILLVNAHGTDTSWFQRLWDYHLCFTDHRIAFISSDGEQQANTAGSVFAYLGDRSEAFKAEFLQYGPTGKLS
jgi:DNA N-6-adenine-methyltransferase (Dam)